LLVTLSTTEGATLALTASAALFSTTLSPTRTYAYVATVASWIRQVAPLVVADFTFTAEADDDTLTATAHGLITGDGPVRVANSGGALPGGLAAATDYWVIRLTDDTLKLAATRANAFAGTAIALSTDGTGTQTLSDTADTERPAASAGAGSSLIPANVTVLVDGALGDTLSGIRASADGTASLTPAARAKVG
jgi:hypothetical protein